MFRKMLFVVAFLILVALPSASTTQAQGLVEYCQISEDSDAHFQIMKLTVVQSGVEQEIVEGDSPYLLPQDTEAEAAYANGKVHLKLKVEGEATTGILASQIGGFGNLETYEMTSQPMGNGHYEIKLEAEGTIPATVGDEVVTCFALLPVLQP